MGKREERGLAVRDGLSIIIEDLNPHPQKFSVIPGRYPREWTEEKYPGLPKGAYSLSFVLWVSSSLLSFYTAILCSEKLTGSYMLYPI